MLDAVILSDLHLGSNNCEAKRICHLLERLVHKQLRTRRLILNGDVFDSFDFRRLTKKHWKVLSLLRKLSDQLEIIWLCGNHDGSPEDVSHLLGVQVMDDYVLESGERRILVLHGHIFDDFLDKHPILTWMGDTIYYFLQWLDSTHTLARRAKHGSKIFLRCARKIHEGAVELAQKRDCHAVCCGHTHSACASEELVVPYFNSGCWTELPCTYLTVANGLVRVHHFEDETDLAAVRPVAVETTMVVERKTVVEETVSVVEETEPVPVGVEEVVSGAG
jgi:UDP-2,3-diacylglucosamine pyrophosphatase LpxH